VKYRVRLTAKAEADVDGVLRWFHERQATFAGGRWLARLMVKIDTLKTHPKRCGIADESADLDIEIRELLFGKRYGAYRILFQIEGRTVQILRVWHGARDRVSPKDL
jgi:plasmid stabilization system protein ParE